MCISVLLSQEKETHTLVWIQSSQLVNVCNSCKISMGIGIFFADITRFCTQTNVKGILVPCSINGMRIFWLQRIIHFGKGYFIQAIHVLKDISFRPSTSSRIFHSGHPHPLGYFIQAIHVLKDMFADVLQSYNM